MTGCHSDHPVKVKESAGTSSIYKLIHLVKSVSFLFCIEVFCSLCVSKTDCRLDSCVHVAHLIDILNIKVLVNCGLS